MLEEDRARLAETRRLVFTNLANGVTVERVMPAFHLSEKEVRDHFDFVARKIREYLFRRGLPRFACESISDAFNNKRAAFDVLQKLGARYLTSDFIVTKLTTVSLKDKVADERLQEAAARQAEQGRV